MRPIAWRMAASAGAGVTGSACRIQSGWAPQAIAVDSRQTKMPDAEDLIVCTPHAKVVVWRRLVLLDLGLQGISNYKYHPYRAES